MIEKGYRRFMFFSDDIQWCKSIDADKVFPNCFFSYSEGKNETEDLVAMSCCASQIISNSTMSWWAAELNRNADKIVIAPSEKNWFGPDNPYKVSDLYRPEVIQIEY
jgi:GTP-dependent phosphoenolpyruvate carboxykinase